MKPRNKPSLKLRTWEYFCVFTVFLLVVIWLLQVVFLQYDYIDAMAFQTRSNARELVSLYEKGELNESTVRTKAYKNNLSVIIMDEDRNVISASDAMGEMDENRIRWLNRYAESVGDLFTEVKKAPKHELYYQISSEENDNKVLLYAAYSEHGVVEGESFIIVISQIAPIQSVNRVLQRQFVSITAIALLLALIFAYLMARRFAKPVEKLNQSARQLALGNPDVRFDPQDSYREIEELAGTLNYAAEEISRSNQLRRELMANVSHDLRTPLTMIKMYAEMIRDLTGDNKEKREKNLKVIIDETDRLSLLVQDILDLSRMEATNHVGMEPKALDMVALINKVLERFAVMTEQGYHFTLDAPQQAYVLGDEARLEQVVYNLLSNAINYTGEDQKVLVRVTNKFESVRVEVIDTGKGIPQEELANIWDRYYRAKTHIRSKVGTGLGLSIVKSILVAHNADFGIESTLGVGSDFWFELRSPDAKSVLRLPEASESTETIDASEEKE